MLPGNLRHQPHFLRGEDNARGVTRVRHQDGPSVLVDQRLNPGPVRIPIPLLWRGGNWADRAAGYPDKGIVVGIKGLRNQDLVAVVQNAGQGNLQRLAAAGRRQDVPLLKRDIQLAVIALHRLQIGRYARGRCVAQNRLSEFPDRVKKHLRRLNVRLSDV